ncbi:hypothetical protein [Patulibacter sp. SYSU D01012]|uniref:hypothetical protein n=1 Tax=Patulibacter sp. SYSU D01012 TaxID=2817381 RepID=UPI001B302CDB|nr:hypothetical protein [Patulibacter sp. SYSU D01012]
MPVPLAISAGGGSGSGGPDAVVIVVAVIAALVVLPALVGLALRAHDARRPRGRDDDPADQRRDARREPFSHTLGGAWGNAGWAQSPRAGWTIVGALAAAVLVVWLLIR